MKELNVLKKCKKNSFIKRSPTERVIFSFVFVLFAVYAFILIYPLYFSFTASLLKDGRTYVKDPMAFPIVPYFSNYLKAFTELKIRETSFLGMFWNSVWYAGGATAMSIFSSAMLAYVVAKYNFRGRNFLYMLAIIIMIVPTYGTEAAKYRLMSQLGCVDSPLFLICSGWAFGTYFLLIYSFFKGLSWSYSEAAFIDGAGHFYVFFHIMMPMALPSVTAVAVTGFIGTWNNWSQPLLYFPNMPTLATGLWQYERQMQYKANQPIYYAGALMSMIPLFVIFYAMQNTIMSKVYLGGLKG